MLSDSIYQEEHIPTQFERFWRSFRANNLAMFGLWSLLFIALVTILSPWIAPYDRKCTPAYCSCPLLGARGTVDYFLGTDDLGEISCLA